MEERLLACLDNSAVPDAKPYPCPAPNDNAAVATWQLFDTIARQTRDPELPGWWSHPRTPRSKNIRFSDM